MNCFLERSPNIPLIGTGQQSRLCYPHVKEDYAKNHESSESGQEEGGEILDVEVTLTNCDENSSADEIESNDVVEKNEKEHFAILQKPRKSPTSKEEETISEVIDKSKTKSKPRKEKYQSIFDFESPESDWEGKHGGEENISLTSQEDEMKDEEKVLVGKNKVNLDGELTKLDKAKTSRKRTENLNLSNIFSFIDSKIGGSKTKEAHQISSSEETFLSSEEDDYGKTKSMHPKYDRTESHSPDKSLPHIIKSRPDQKNLTTRKLKTSPIQRRQESLETKINSKEKKLKKMISLDFDLPATNTVSIASVDQRGKTKGSPSARDKMSPKKDPENMNKGIIEGKKEKENSNVNAISVSRAQIHEPKIVKFDKINIGSPPSKATEKMQKSAQVNQEEKSEGTQQMEPKTERRISSAESSSSSSSGAELYVRRCQ